MISKLLKKAVISLLSASWFMFIPPLIGGYNVPILHLFFLSPFLLIYSLPVILTYGVAISYLLDFLVKSSKHRPLIKFIAYPIFGIIPGLLVDSDQQEIILSGLISSLLFYLFEMMLERRAGWGWAKSPSTWILLVFPYVVILLFTLIKYIIF